jgi:amidase
MTLPLPTGAPHTWTAIECLAALRARRISSVELLQHQLARRARLDPAIGAVNAVNAEAALAAAQAADCTAGGGALAGLPMTVKDSLETTDLPTTCGLPPLAGHLAAHDADAVALLRGAGAVIWGKTNTPLAASDHQSFNPLHGLTRNPWDGTRTPGGSSGGAAAALAAGFTALELGSDIGGSIRIPSHYCGVYGHKPSYGIVPGRGHIPPMPGERLAPPLAVVGPLARSADDLALALGVVAQASPDEAAGWRLALPAPAQARLADFRVGVWLDAYPVDSAYAQALEAFAADLAREGVQVQRIAAPVDPQAAWHTYLGILFGVVAGGIPAEEQAALDAAAQAAGADSLAARLAQATRPTMTGWLQLLAAQAELRAQWAAAFMQVDLVLCPVSLGEAFAHITGDGSGVLPQLARTLPVDGRPEPYLHNLQWPGLATLAHLPATVRPLPARPARLPLGVQLIGPYLHDLRTIRFAQLCDQAFGRAPMPTLD